MSIDNSTSIFITGNSRSGTTMMSRILGNNSSVFTFQELHFYDELVSDNKLHAIVNEQESIQFFSTLIAIQRNGYFGSRDVTPFLIEAQQYLKDKSGLTYSKLLKEFLFYETVKNNKTIPCEQTPQNIFNINEINQTFLLAKFIVMVRDPREVLVSQKFKWKRRTLSGGAIPFGESVRSRLNYHPITISKIWNSAMQNTQKYSDFKNLMVIKYEDLVNNPEKIIKQVCSHIGIEYTSSMLDIPVVGSSNFSDSSNRGIDSGKSQQWISGALSETEIEICQLINRYYMKFYNYELITTNASLFSVLRYRISQPFRLMISLFFNLHRLKNPGKLIKRVLGK